MNENWFCMRWDGNPCLRRASVSMIFQSWCAQRTMRTHENLSHEHNILTIAIHNTLQYIYKRSRKATDIKLVFFGTIFNFLAYREDPFATCTFFILDDSLKIIETCCKETSDFF